MPATETIQPQVDDPADVAYWAHRKVVRRRQVLAILGLMIAATSFVTWKVARHLSAALWLEANHYHVDWTIEKENWKQGGSTTVRNGARSYYAITNARFIDLRFLTNLHRLEELDLSTLLGLRDAHLSNLGDLIALRRLRLDRSRLSSFGNNEAGRLTDATLARIGRLTKLEELNLGGQRITDAGLRYLVGLDRLRALDLEATNITDAGLEHLKALRGLKSLDLTGTRVTAEGVASFEAAHPGVKVLFDPPAVTPSTNLPR